MTTATRARVAPADVKLTTFVPVSAGEATSKKTVWRNAEECAHRWASTAHYAGRAGNVFFRDSTIYSYGAHFPMARHVRRVNGKGGTAFVLVTTRTYSVTTSAHLSDVRAAVRGRTVYYVDNVTAETRGQHLANLRAIETNALHFVKKSKTARKRKEEYEADAARLVEKGNEYAEAVGLRERIKAPEGGDLAAWAADAIAAEKKAEERDAKERSRSGTRRFTSGKRAGRLNRGGARTTPTRPPTSRSFGSRGAFWKRPCGSQFP